MRKILSFLAILCLLLGYVQTSQAATIHSGIEESGLIIPATMHEGSRISIRVGPTGSGHAIIKLFTASSATVTVSVVPSTLNLVIQPPNTTPTNPRAGQFRLAHNGDISGGGSLTYTAPAGSSPVESEVDIGGSVRTASTDAAGLYLGDLTLDVTEVSGGITHQFSVPFQLIFAYLANGQLSNQRALVFPTEISSSSPISSIVSPDNVGAARFAAGGPANGRATLTVVNHITTLSRNGTGIGPLITVDTFTFGCEATGGRIRFDSTGLVQNICVGGRARFPANIPAGSYSGSDVLRMTF